jgi:electron transfer flavoprotein alpha subunit
MTRVLIVAEHDGERLEASTARCVSCAADLEPDAIDVVILAEDGSALAQQAARIDAVGRVLVANHAANRAPSSAILAPQVAALATGYSHLLGPSTTFGKDLMPRVAALLGVGQISDIMSVEGPYCFKRPAYAGNVIETVQAASERLLVGTVRMASYAPAAEARQAAVVEPVPLNVELPSHTRFVELKTQRTDRPDLQTAARVVAGGRAFGSAENFRLAQRLADKLGAALGASRAAVDAGYASNDLQVGQTGKVIAPQLYIALGISGAIQHVTGIKDAGTIVAVNKDPEAPIFEIADLGLVADVFEAVPELLAALEKRGAEG